MEIKGAVVLITGASSGIGRAASLAFDEAGARVAMAARRRERLEENAERMQHALVVPTDLADETQAAAMVEKTVAHYGRLDVLINNAAAAVLARSDAIEPADLRRVLETNLVGHVIATNHAVRHMRRAGGGHIINVTSTAGWMGTPLLAIYAASKAAVSGWTRSLQTEWAGTEIFVSEYSPGLIATEMGPATTGASELGELDFNVFGDSDQAWLMRRFARPTPPERVGADLVELVRKPRLMMHTNLFIRVISWLGQYPRLRRLMGGVMSNALRRRLGLSVFTD